MECKIRAFPGGQNCAIVESSAVTLADAVERLGEQLVKICARADTPGRKELAEARAFLGR